MFLEFDLQGLLQCLLLFGQGRQALGRQFRAAQGLTQLLHEHQLQTAHRQPAPVPAAVVVIKAATIEHLLLHSGLDPTGQVAGTGHGVQAEHAVGHAHVQVLSLAAVLARDHRRQQADHPMQRAPRDIRGLDAQG